jgi:hypothetical protein
VYVRGTSLWHVVRQFNGGIRTLCGRVLPLDAPVSDRVPDVHLCQPCRARRRIDELRS